VSDSPDGIPSGSTVMDMMVPKDTDPAAPAAAAEEKPGEKTPQPATKKPDKKVDPAHVAAKAILDKYSRRGRG
jgi:hypothetical protein